MIYWIQLQFFSPESSNLFVHSFIKASSSNLLFAASSKLHRAIFCSQIHQSFIKQLFNSFINLASSSNRLFTATSGKFFRASPSNLLFTRASSRNFFVQSSSKVHQAISWFRHILSVEFMSISSLHTHHKEELQQQTRKSFGGYKTYALLPSYLHLLFCSNWIFAVISMLMLHMKKIPWQHKICVP